MMPLTMDYVHEIHQQITKDFEILANLRLQNSWEEGSHEQRLDKEAAIKRVYEAYTKFKRIHRCCSAEIQVHLFVDFANFFYFCAITQLQTTTKSHDYLKVFQSIENNTEIRLEERYYYFYSLLKILKNETRNSNDKNNTTESTTTFRRAIHSAAFACHYAPNAEIYIDRLTDLIQLISITPTRNVTDFPYFPFHQHPFEFINQIHDAIRPAIEKDKSLVVDKFFKTYRLIKDLEKVPHYHCYLHLCFDTTVSLQFHEPEICQEFTNYLHNMATTKLNTNES